MEGLDNLRVEQQRAIHGWNTTDDDQHSPETFYSKVFDQLCNPLIGLLVLSSLVSCFLGHYDNAVGILLAISLVGIVGAIQESKTEATLEALKQLAPARAHVIRDGKLAEVNSRELVPGDLVEVRAGDRIPADLRLLKVNGLVADESILSGESAGRECLVDEEVYMGTSVSHGWGRGVVAAIGQSSKFGKMVGLIRDTKCTSKTPLQQELDSLAHKLTFGSGVLIALISLYSYLTVPDANLMDILTTAVSLAVAAIPEGLPLVSTVTLALAVRRLAGRGVIVKKMSAVEAMGACRVICFDKTGTLTMNSPSVAKFAFEEDRFDKDEFVKLTASCTDVSQTDRGELIGNVMDTCLVKFANGATLYEKDLQEDAVLFSSEKRFMHAKLLDGRTVGKGAIEAFANVPEQYMALTKEWASNGLRCIGVGLKNHAAGFDLIGVIGFQDTLRSNAASVIHQLALLSVSPAMLTGDSEATAQAVADSLKWPPHCAVKSRQCPSDKLAYIDNLQKAHMTTVMVGDGVNDGAAVRRAQVGIAMGGAASTDVARQAADIVLCDDRLDGIVEAILEGRAICINIQRFLGFQLSCSIASLLLVSLAPQLGRLSPLHLLLLNIVMDGPPAQSLAVSHIPKAALLCPPTIRLLDLAVLARCTARAVLMVAICAYYTRAQPARTLLPPLLISSICNAYSWTPDYSNQYLALCTLAMLSLLVLAKQVPLLESLVGLGQLGLAETAELSLMAAFFFAAMLCGRMAVIPRRLFSRLAYQKL